MKEYSGLLEGGARLLLVWGTLFLLALHGCDIAVERPAEAGDSGEEAAAPQPDTRALEGEIDSMLTASAGAWNAGDLEGFLDDYSAGPGMTFLGGSGRIRGIDEVRERYRASYWAPGTARDSLRFEDVEVRPLGPDHALATGRYVLHDPAEGATSATGWFTLVLEREAGGWRIVHDHSS